MFVNGWRRIRAPPAHPIVPAGSPRKHASPDGTSENTAGRNLNMHKQALESQIMTAAGSIVGT